jgi:Bacterial conjugation TrbI-like protein
MSVIPIQSQASSRGARMLRTALGPEIAAWLEDASVIEVMLNPDGRLWIDRLGAGIADTGSGMSAADGERIIRLVAHHVGAEVHAKAPRVPQGSRLIGDYDADVAFGQSRVLLAWNRLILPDGRSIVLERQPASDPSGFAGLQDGTNYHWGGVLKAAMISTLLGVGSELGAGNDSDLTRAIRRGTQDSVNRAGEQIVSRELNVRPSLTIRPGFPVRVLVTRDLVLGGER